MAQRINKKELLKRIKKAPVMSPHDYFYLSPVIRSTISDDIRKICESEPFREEQNSLFFSIIGPHISNRPVAYTYFTHPSNSAQRNVEIKYKEVIIDEHVVNKAIKEWSNEESHEGHLAPDYTIPAVYYLIENVFKFIDGHIEGNDNIEYPFNESISSILNMIHLTNPDFYELIKNHIHTYLYTKEFDLTKITKEISDFYFMTFNSFLHSIVAEKNANRSRKHEEYHSSMYGDPYYPYPYSNSINATYTKQPYTTTTTTSMPYNEYHHYDYDYRKEWEYGNNSVSNLISNEYKNQIENITSNNIRNIFHHYHLHLNKNTGKVNDALSKIINSLEDTEDNTFLNILKSYDKSTMNTNKINMLVCREFTESMAYVNSQACLFLSTFYKHHEQENEAKKNHYRAYEDYFVNNPYSINDNQSWTKGYPKI